MDNMSGAVQLPHQRGPRRPLIQSSEKALLPELKLTPLPTNTDPVLEGRSADAFGAPRQGREAATPPTLVAA